MINCEIAVGDKDPYQSFGICYIHMLFVVVSLYRSVLFKFIDIHFGPIKCRDCTINNVKLKQLYLATQNAFFVNFITVFFRSNPTSFSALQVKTSPSIASVTVILEEFSFD